MPSINKKLIIGSAQFIKNYGDGKKINKDLLSMFKSLQNYKNIFFDTSPKYDLAEQFIGKNFNKVKVGSKLPSMKNIPIKNIDKYIVSTLNKTLKKLNRNYLDYYLVHDELDLISKKKNIIFKPLETLKNKKIIKKIGVSIYSYPILKNIIKNFNIDIAQVPFNLFDRRLLFFYKSNIKYTRKVKFHVRSVYLQGLLLNENRDLKKYTLDCYKPVFKKFDHWSEKNSTPKIEACLGFVKKFDFIDKFIIGFENINQLKATNKYFSKTKLKFPKHIFSNEKKLINPSLWKNE
jgi:aryl-alcohol dehydrogenase-like predicted oxidoreductase